MSKVELIMLIASGLYILGFTVALAHGWISI